MLLDLGAVAEVGVRATELEVIVGIQAAAGVQAAQEARAVVEVEAGAIVAAVEVIALIIRVRAGLLTDILLGREAQHQIAGVPLLIEAPKQKVPKPMAAGNSHPAKIQHDH